MVSAWNFGRACKPHDERVLVAVDPLLAYGGTDSSLAQPLDVAVAMVPRQPTPLSRLGFLSATPVADLFQHRGVMQVFVTPMRIEARGMLQAYQVIQSNDVNQQRVR